MSKFLQLPEESPAEPLMNALVHLGDMLGEHWDLLPGDVAKATFTQTVLAASVLLKAHTSGDHVMRTALQDATGEE